MTTQQPLDLEAIKARQYVFTGTHIERTPLDDIQFLVKEVERLRAGLQTIADMVDQPILGPSHQDYVERQSIDERQAHEIGAHKAFWQAADMARALLGKE